jgi:DNA polymerase-3 subunit alpha
VVPFASGGTESPHTGRIRFGLVTIKNFGEGIADAIIAERETSGPFTSLHDFLSRVQDRNLNKKSLESLIKVGAFDVFGERGQLLANLDLLLGYNRERIAERETAQDSLFGGLSGGTSDLTLAPAEAANMAETLLWEKELLGVYLSGHPLNAVRSEVEKRPRIGAIKRAVVEGDDLAIVRLKGETITTGLIESVRELLTKKGDRMAFVRLVDEDDFIELVAFPEPYHEYRDLLAPGTCVAVKGRLTIRNDEPSIALEKVKQLQSANVPAPDAAVPAPVA